MKKKLLLIAATTLMINASCNHHGHEDGNANCVTVHKYTPTDTSSSNLPYTYIGLDSGDKMISSYLKSINYLQNDTDIYDLIYNADSLRAYLSNSKIVKLKIMFAHTLDYINNGGKNKYAGYQSGALTMIMAGYDKDGNYVYYYPTTTSAPEVMDHCQPCPNNCPNYGSAASDFLEPNTHERR